jgi:polyisoprenoid-binding protein YceI
MRMFGLAVALLSTLGLLSHAEARLVRDSAKATVAFTAKAPGGMTIVGSTADLEVRDGGKMVVIVVPLKGLATGIALRDRHMREKYLQVAQYPTAELAVERASLKGLTPGADGKGVMKIHGKSRPVTFHYSAKKEGGVIQVVGSTRVDIRDFGIEIPSFLGVTVKPEVDIAVTFAVKDV